MIDYFLLNKSQVYGDDKLQMIESGRLCKDATDFAKYKSKITKAPYRCMDWWLSKTDDELFARIFDFNGKVLRVNPKLEGYGIRPAVMYEQIKPFSEERYSDEEITVIHFGSYPQSYASDDQNNTLNYLFQEGYLEATSKPNVFKYYGKYVIKDEDADRWILEFPLVWVVDNKTGIAVCDKIIDAGKKDYAEVIHFLKNTFGKVILSESKVKEFETLLTYNNLVCKKKAVEEKLKMINDLLSSMDEDVKRIRRKNKRNEEVL